MYSGKKKRGGQWGGKFTTSLAGFTAANLPNAVLTNSLQSTRRRKEEDCLFAMTEGEEAGDKKAKSRQEKKQEAEC